MTGFHSRTALLELPQLRQTQETFDRSIDLRRAPVVIVHRLAIAGDAPAAVGVTHQRQLAIISLCDQQHLGDVSLNESGHVRLPRGKTNPHDTFLESSGGVSPSARPLPCDRRLMYVD